MTNPSMQVNYDTVAASYDRRSRDLGYLSGAKEALQALARQVAARQILDLGCGTGRSLEGLAGAGLHCYGLDFSGGMLTQARLLDPAYRLVQASAPRPPFAAASFELVFCAHAFHHFPDKAQVVQSAYRLLRPGGAFAIVNFDPHDHQRDDWTIYRYFEGTYERDLERFPAITAQEAMLAEAGFQQVSSSVVQLIGSEVPAEEILESYWLRKDSSSQLILLSEEAYQAGRRRIHRRVAEAQANKETLIFKTRLQNRMCYGFKELRRD